MKRQAIIGAALVLSTTGLATAQANWDANTDGFLDPGEFVTGFGNLNTFASFDTDADGSLNADEWNSGLGPVGEYVNMDLNADGGVDAAEYNALLFNRYDPDGSGTIDADELAQVEADLAEDGLLSR